MAGLGIAMGIRMYLGQTKQFLEVQSKKTQHNLATSRSQMCMGAKTPYTAVTGSSTIPLMKVSLYIKLNHSTSN